MTAAELSLLAYSSHPENYRGRQVKLYRNKYTSTEVISVLVEEPDGRMTLYFSYRGSKETWDFVSDARFWPRRHPGIKRGFAHRGLSICAESVYDWVQFEILDHEHHIDRIVFGGHSKGAGETLLTHHSVANIYPGIVESIVFGSPAVFSPAAARWFDNLHRDEVLRVENNVDLVPRLATYVGYKHVGQHLYIDRRGQQHLDSAGWFFRWQDGWRATLGGFGNGKPESLAKHEVSSYIEQLQKAKVPVGK